MKIETQLEDQIAHLKAVSRRFMYLLLATNLIWATANLAHCQRNKKECSLSALELNVVPKGQGVKQ